MPKARNIYIIEGNRKVTAVEIAKELNMETTLIQSRLQRGKVLISELTQAKRLKPEKIDEEYQYNKNKHSWDNKKIKTSWNGPDNDKMLKLAMLKI